MGKHGKTKTGYTCHACTERIPKVGAVEIKEGWGKAHFRVGFGRKLRSVTLVHCPGHGGPKFGNALAQAAKKLAS